MTISQYTLPQFIVDAFTDTVFKGNPAAVCLLDEWLSDNTLQNIARENNLSETAFTVKNDDYYELRWFTPGGEIDLCGHATLATAFVLFQFKEKKLKILPLKHKVANLWLLRKLTIMSLISQYILCSKFQSQVRWKKQSECVRLKRGLEGT